MTASRQQAPGLSGPGVNLRIVFRRGDFRLRMSWQSEGARRIGIFGESGAGKSTLLHLLAGLLRPDAGELRFGTERWFAGAEADPSRAGWIGSRGSRWVSPERRGVGYVFQDARVFPHLSVVQNLVYGDWRKLRTAHGGSRKWSERICEALGLAELLGARGDALSGGQQKRVAIGRALWPRPRLILCDEAETGLDAHSRAGFGALLNDVLADGAVVIRVSHDLADLLAWSDHLLYCRAGELVFAGPPGGLARSSEAAAALWLPVRISAKLWLRGERLHWLPRRVIADPGVGDNTGSFAQMIPARVQAKDAEWLELALEPDAASARAPVILRVSSGAIPGAAAWLPGDELWCAVPTDALVHETI